MKYLETILVQIGRGFFAEADHINVLLSFFSFLIGIFLTPFSFGTSQSAINRRRFCGAFLLLALAFEAGSAAVYALSVFIVATLITELSFLSGLAAIFWNRSWAYQRPANDAEVRAKSKQDAENELIDAREAGVKKESARFIEFTGDIGDDAGRARGPESALVDLVEATGRDYERCVFDALLATDLFEEVQRETALTTSADPGQPLVVVDGIGKAGLARYVIEVKRRVTDLARVTSQIQFAMTALKNTPELRMRISVRVRGILITGRTGRPSEVGEDIICLFFDSEIRKFTNIDHVKAWMKRS
jgi:hypothetical protein